MLDERTQTVSLPGQRVGASPQFGRADAEAVAGEPATWELMADHRDTAVWRVAGPRGLWALKVGTGESLATVVREATVLQQAHSQVPALSYGGRAKAGRAESAAWLITPWLEGPSTWSRFEVVRERRDADRAAALAAAVDMCAAVGALHAAGWVHGDLQPHHTVHTTGAVRLIGCTWTSSPTLAPPHTYLGGLVHLMSPELMSRAESSVRPVVTDPPAEVYALAAGLWWAATGTWPLDYAQLGIDPGKFTAKVLRQVLAQRWPPLGHIPQWPQLEEVLRHVLTRRPQDRPTALNLAEWLRSMPL